MSNFFSTTPLLKGIRQQGSTFYTFSSATNDTILLFSSNNIRMSFSKFACLRLPNWENVNKQRLYKNPLDLESVNDTASVDDANQFFTKAYLQNYVENFTAIVDANRTDSTYSHFAEAGFWKAMQSVSRDNYVADTIYQTMQLVVAAEYDDINLVTRQKYKERQNVTNDYEQLVQFVGDINMMNHVKSSGKEYLEVYGHVPTSAGKMKDIQFTRNPDLYPTLAQVPAGSGELYITGQQDAYENADASKKTYAQAVYDTIDRKYNLLTDKDQLQIDWLDIESDLAKQTKWNQGNFEFNAVLLYYDIWDITNPSQKIRNLYGILILDKFESSSPTTSAIDRFKKYQPDSNQAGNAFGFRFNLMFSNSTNQITSEIVINDYSTISMELYMAALQRLQTITNLYEELAAQSTGWANDINEMKQILLSLQLGSMPSNNIVVQNGKLLIFKTTGNSSNVRPGDVVFCVKDGIFYKAVYRSGPTSDIESYELIDNINLS